MLKTIAKTKVTQQDIADVLGVSRTLVTHALHGTNGSGINGQTRDAIQKAAREMNYQPRNLTTNNIGYVIPFEALGLQGEAQELVRLEREAQRHGYRLTLVSSDVHDTLRLRESLSPKTVDGVIFAQWCQGRIRDVLPPGIPWVLTSAETDVPSQGIERVTVDLISTLDKATEYLLGFGHRRICLLTGRATIGFHRNMWQGVLQAMARHGLSRKNAVLIEDEDEEVPVRLKQIWRGPEPPTAFIAGSPEKAVTLSHLLLQNGLRVPLDASVLAVFDSPLYRSLPPLLTCTSAMQEVPARAIGRLLEKMKETGSVARQQYFTGEIIERDSVAPPRAN